MECTPAGKNENPCYAYARGDVRGNVQHPLLPCRLASVVCAVDLSMLRFSSAIESITDTNLHVLAHYSAVLQFLSLPASVTFLTLFQTLVFIKSFSLYLCE